MPADLAPLAPRRSPLRNVALGLLAALVLVGAWFSPALLRPSLTGSSGGGWSVELPESRTLLTVSQLDPDPWPHASVTGVEALPGATPEAAWIFTELAPAMTQPAATTPHEYLAEAYPGVAFPAGGNLPARVHSTDPDGTVEDGQLMIAIAWRIDECDLVHDPDSPYADREDQVQAVMRNALGAESRAPLGYAASPTTALQLDSAICEG